MAGAPDRVSYQSISLANRLNNDHASVDAFAVRGDEAAVAARAKAAGYTERVEVTPRTEDGSGAAVVVYMTPRGKAEFDKLATRTDLQIGVQADPSRWQLFTNGDFHPETAGSKDTTPL